MSRCLAGGDMIRPPETSEGCETLGNRSEGQSLALLCAGPVFRSSPEKHCRQSRTAPTQAADPARRCGLLGLLQGRKETKIKKRRQKPALGNE